MTAPPPRPHINSVRSHASYTFSSTQDWGDDDAWDSGSDSENLPNTRTNSLSRSSKSDPNTPRPAPIPISSKKNSISHAHSTRGNHRGSASSNSADRSSASIGNLSFSFTHVQAPSPSSYTPAPVLSSHAEDIDWQERDERERAGWTIVSSDATTGTERTLVEHDADLDGSLVLGELEPDGAHHDDTDDESVKEGKDAIKPDVDQLVKSEYNKYFITIHR
jgi:TBC1 domain family member 2